MLKKGSHLKICSGEKRLHLRSVTLREEQKKRCEHCFKTVIFNLLLKQLKFPEKSKETFVKFRDLRICLIPERDMEKPN